MLTSDTHRPLNQAACQQLAASLGETPTTAVLTHALKHNVCTAFGLDDRSQFEAAVVELNYLPGEPFVFGRRAEAVWALLKILNGWGCVLAEKELGHELGRLIEADFGQPARYHDDIIYTLKQPVKSESFNYTQ